MVIRLRMPRQLIQAIQNRQRADYFQFGDAYEQAILRVIEKHFELFEDQDNPLLQKAREDRQASEL